MAKGQGQAAGLKKMLFAQYLLTIFAKLGTVNASRE